MKPILIWPQQACPQLAHLFGGELELINDTLFMTWCQILRFTLLVIEEIHSQVTFDYNPIVSRFNTL